MKTRTVLIGMERGFFLCCLLALLLAALWLGFIYIRSHSKEHEYLRQGKAIVGKIKAFQRSNNRLPENFNEVDKFMKAERNPGHWFYYKIGDDNFGLYIYTGWLHNSLNYVSTPPNTASAAPSGWYLQVNDPENDNGERTRPVSSSE